MPHLCPSGGSLTFRTKAQLAIGFLVQNRFTLSGVFSSAGTEEGSAVLRRWLQAWEKEMPRNKGDGGGGCEHWDPSWCQCSPFRMHRAKFPRLQSRALESPRAGSGHGETGGVWGSALMYAGFALRNILEIVVVGSQHIEHLPNATELDDLK